MGPFLNPLILRRFVSFNHHLIHKLCSAFLWPSSKQALTMHRSAKNIILSLVHFGIKVQYLNPRSASRGGRKPRTRAQKAIVLLTVWGSRHLALAPKGILFRIMEPFKALRTCYLGTLGCRHAGYFGSPGTPEMATCQVLSDSAKEEVDKDQRPL